MGRAILATLCCAVSVAACSSEEHVGPPNVIVVCVDALRPDHLGVYGAAPGVSPNVDALAREAVVFERAFSVASWTKPSVASLLTGLHPAQHQVVHASGSGVDVLPDDVVTIAERLAGAGYRTAAFVDNEHLQRRTSRFDQGFETFVEDLEGAAPLVNAFLDWVDGADDRPFFVYLHILDPHWPYTPQGRFGEQGFTPDERLQVVHWGLRNAHWWLLRERVNRGRVELDASERALLEKLYDGEVSATDAVLGRMLRLLRADGVLDHSLFVLTADHGEGFLEHGRLDHGYGPYDELLRVPLIVRYPNGAHGGERVGALVQTVDVAPTALEAAGIRHRDGIAAESLSSFLSPTFAARARGVAAEEFLDGGHVVALRTGSHKYIRKQRGGSPRGAAAPEVPLDLAVGDRVQLEGIYAEGEIIAAQVKRVGNEDHDHEVAGPITAVDRARGVLEVVGYEVRVDDRTRLRDEEGSFELGDLRALEWVRVEGVVRDGKMQAQKLERIFEGWAKEIELEGIIDRFDANDDGEVRIELCGRRAVVDLDAVWKNFDERRRPLLPPSEAESAPGDVEELYDLASDPMEQRNIATSAPGALSGLREELADLQAMRSPGTVRAAPRAVLDGETRERLRLLGYLGEDPS